MKFLKSITIVFTAILLLASCSVFKTKSCCNMKYIKDVKKSRINLALFTEIDTTIGTGVYGNTFNRMYICPDGTLILGNVDSRGRKHGEWSFKKKTATGYEGYFYGEFRYNKMNGYWAHGPYSSLYKNGRHIKTNRIPF